MKKTIQILVLFFGYFSYSQIIPIPDQNFKNKLLQANTNNNIAGFIKVDLNNNGEIEQSEALNVTYLFLFTSNISSLDGIEFFTNLQFLFCHYNSLDSLNISNLTQLKILRCDVNNLTSLNFSGLVNIEGINCDYNQISNLSFTGLNNLKSALCANNQITQLDFSTNAVFRELICKNNNLTSLNLKNGINQDFSNVNFNDCWKTGNPNLANICVDASELASVQNYLNNCGTVQTINITSNCGLGSEEFVANEFLVYPNPNAGNFIIDLRQESEPYQLMLFTVLGEKVFSKQLIPAQLNVIDITNFTKGFYIVTISNSNNTKTQKIIKN